MTAAGRKRAGSSSQRWSQRVAETSDALDLTEGVFTRDDPASIARSLKRSAERSRRRKAHPFRSAMSMLTYYINRAGGTLPKNGGAGSWNRRRMNCARCTTVRGAVGSDGSLRKDTVSAYKRECLRSI